MPPIELDDEQENWLRVLRLAREIAAAQGRTEPSQEDLDEARKQWAEKAAARSALADKRIITRSAALPLPDPRVNGTDDDS